jgi:uncharacterized protein YdeI (YjbR/CyaY-like superfamily)
VGDIEIINCADAAEWDAWLTENAAKASAAWVRCAKKGAVGLAAAAAGDLAICHGWIDSHRRALDATHFLQRYSPRRPGSPWSRINVERASTLEATGQLRPAGLAQVQAAKADGRWVAAYAPQAAAETPADLAAALTENARARTAYEALSRTDRYNVFLPLLKARTSVARATALRRAVTYLETSGSQRRLS